MNKNHIRIDPQIERCVSHVQWLVIKPAFRQTVTTTYCKQIKKNASSSGTILITNFFFVYKIYLFFLEREDVLF